MPNSKLACLIGEVATGRCEKTIPELVESLELDNALGLLGQIAEIKKTLANLNIRISPDLDKGEIDLIRLLKFQVANANNPLDVLNSDLKQEESSGIEFKSTYRVDLARHQSTGENVQQCQSDAVIHSALKTIAAFLNTDGGRLYIGISDHKSIIGLEYDFQVRGTPNQDQLELLIRGHIQSKFKDGSMIGDFISFTFVPVEGKLVALIDVSARRSLSFLNKSGEPYVLLYRRQGNRTVTVDITEMEEYLRNRWRLA